VRKRTNRKQIKTRRRLSGGMFKTMIKGVGSGTMTLGSEIVKDAVKKEISGSEYSRKLNNMNENVKPKIIEDYSENKNPNTKITMSPRAFGNIINSNVVTTPTGKNFVEM